MRDATGRALARVSLKKGGNEAPRQISAWVSLWFRCADKRVLLMTRHTRQVGATWTLFLDTDEFLVPETTSDTRAGGANSLQPLLDAPPFSQQSCVFLPRVMFSNYSDNPDDLYTTRKYRRHLSRNTHASYVIPGKGLLDVSRLETREMVTADPHNNISPACKKNYNSAFISPRERQVAKVHHYIGSLQSFLFRKGDARFDDRRREHHVKVTRYGYHRAVGAGTDEDDDLKTWMDDFELEWGERGKDTNVSFTSLMNGLGVRNLRPTTTAAPTTLERAGTCLKFAGPGLRQLCEKNGCWYSEKDLACRPEKDCSLAYSREHCEDLECIWDKQCLVCYNDALRYARLRYGKKRMRLRSKLATMIKAKHYTTTTTNTTLHG